MHCFLPLVSLSLSSVLSYFWKCVHNLICRSYNLTTVTENQCRWLGFSELHVVCGPLHDPFCQYKKIRFSSWCGNTRGHHRYGLSYFNSRFQHEFSFSQNLTVPIQHTGTDRHKQAVLHLQPLKTRAPLACKQLLVCTRIVNCTLAYSIPEAATTTKTHISRWSRGRWEALVYVNTYVTARRLLIQLY